MLTSQAVIDDIVKKINDELNIPIVSEETEGRWIASLLAKISPLVPEWALAAMSTFADGVTIEELQPLKEILVKEINKLLDLPGGLATPEWAEERLITFVIDAVLDYALHGKAVPQG